MTHRRWLIAAVVASRSIASARCPTCECVAEIGVLRTPDEPKDVALNARVITGYVPDPSRKERFVLRAVGGAPVEVTAAKLHIDTYDTLVLTPAAPLAKNTDYELVLLRDTTTLPYAKLHTSDGADTTAPTWEGALHAEYVPADGCATECKWRRGPRLEISAPIPSDDRSGAELVAIWLTSGAAIDYGKPPTAYVRTREDESGGGFGGLGSPEPRFTIVLGGEGPCIRQTVALPRGARRVRVGVKVMDRAGNASAPRELDARLVATK